MNLAKVCLHKAIKRSKKWADRKRRDAQFQERDLVLVKLYDKSEFCIYFTFSYLVFCYVLSSFYGYLRLIFILLVNFE